MDAFDTMDPAPAISNAQDVARFFIQYYNDNDLPITNLMLNKLLYFAQGHCLAEYGRPLFAEPIEAWEYGPVVPAVYREYKPRGRKALLELGAAIDYGDVFDDSTIALLVAVARQYRRYSDRGLVEKSHEEGGPWSKVYVKDEKHTPITEKSMRDGFGQKTLDDFEDEEFTEEEMAEFLEISKAYRNGELETVPLDELD